MAGAGLYKDGKRVDPYKTYKFLVLMDGKPIAGVSKISGLRRTTEVITYNEGGQNVRDHKIPGRTSYDSIIMERGLTDNKEFEEWALMVHPLADASRNLESFKRDLQLVIHDEKGRVIIRYNLYGCWVSEYELPEFDASSNDVTIERIKVELDAWEREAL